MAQLEADQLEAREDLERTWDATSELDPADRVRERQEALKRYEAACARADGIEPAEDGQFGFASDSEMNGALGSWDGRDYRINEVLLQGDTPHEAAATIEHECSHRSDEAKGLAPSHYFEELPEAPSPPSEEGRYTEYADEYEDYISNWDRIDWQDMSEKYVDPPKAPRSPEGDDPQAEEKYNQLMDRYEDAFSKYEWSAGEWLARQRELRS